MDEICLQTSVTPCECASSKGMRDTREEFVSSLSLMPDSEDAGVLGCSEHCIMCRDYGICLCFFISEDADTSQLVFWGALLPSCFAKVKGLSKEELATRGDLVLAMSERIEAIMELELELNRLNWRLDSFIWKSRLIHKAGENSSRRVVALDTQLFVPGPLQEVLDLSLGEFPARVVYQGVIVELLVLWIVSARGSF